MTYMEWTARARRAAVEAAFLLVALAIAPAARASSADCALAVAVEGSEPAHTAVADELARAGVPVAPAPGCPIVNVVVTAQGTALALTITDPYGRVTHRSVADVRTASALIQSTPGADALQPLLPEADALPPRPVLRPGDDAADEVPVPPTEHASSPAAAVVTHQAPAERSPGRGLSLRVAPELAMGSDRSGWAGLSVAGCVVLGPTCLGTLVRFWRDLDADDESNDTVGQRATGEIAVSLDVPFAWRRLELRPGVELGLGWIHMGELVVHPASDDDSDFDQGEVLGGLHVAASYPLAKHWALEASVAANVSLFAHQAPFTVQGARLPGEPLAYGIASLGVRYGSP
jgi:hypothetical protein